PRESGPGAVTFLPAETPQPGAPERPHAASAIAVLVVEATGSPRAGLEKLMARRGMAAEGVASGEEALEALARQRFDALVLDPKLPDMSGADLLEKARERGLLERLPVIVYAGKALGVRERRRLERLAVELVAKGADASE